MQKTAYEMRISDWSSDVCSSDLAMWPPRSPGLRLARTTIAIAFQQLADLANRASRVVLLGGHDGLLHRERQLALAAIAARFGQQAFDALAPVGVEPAFNGLLAQMAAAGTGNVVLALGQFPHDLLQLATGQALTADQGAEDRTT